MSTTYNDIRLFLFTCSGEDNFILKRCKGQIQSRFALLGFFVLFIFVGCFFSATFFTFSMFDGSGRLLSIPMGIIWGAIVVNIYLLLLHTISPAIIPLSSKKKMNKDLVVNNNFLTLSMFLRISFMVLLATIIAQPLNFFILSDSVQNSIQEHKDFMTTKVFLLSNESIVKKEILLYNNFNSKIKSELNYSDFKYIEELSIPITLKVIEDRTFNLSSTLILNNLNTKKNISKKEHQSMLSDLKKLLIKQNYSDNNFENNIQNIFLINNSIKNDFSKYKSELITIINERNNQYYELSNLFNNSKFYIKTIQLLLNENPASWLITALVCLLFLFPIYIKYKIRDLSAEIFKKQEQNEPEIIKLREELINTQNFNWLEKNIKSTNIKNIRTSDYYFQRMLIEHKIILEEYDQAKKKFSEKLTANVKQYNRGSLNRIVPLLEKLKQVNPNKYNEISKEIFEEYVDEEIVKYEYWLDSPFRTKLKHSAELKNNEQEFLDFIYNLEA